MKMEVYDSEDKLLKTIDCDGPEQDFPARIDSSGKCFGCDMEPNYEKITCYKAGSRDPVNNGITLDKFSINNGGERT